MLIKVTTRESREPCLVNSDSIAQVIRDRDLSIIRFSDGTRLCVIESVDQIYEMCQGGE